jgi:hypothetical protein
VQPSDHQNLINLAHEIRKETCHVHHISFVVSATTQVENTTWAKTKQHIIGGSLVAVVQLGTRGYTT